MRRAIDVQYATGGDWPENVDEIGFADYHSPTISEVDVLPGAGTRPLTLEVKLEATWVDDAARLELYPSSASGGYAWRCSSDRAKNLFALLPASCRDGG